ncbi:MAG TPA: 4Fe-4S dicluster domain-containing protein [Methanomassiliicoccales archaeon]|nr:4Fe-4S dicluster domain-containing protein [Methanomassiliicoccales archaeon]
MSGGRVGVQVRSDRCQGCLECEIACLRAHGEDAGAQRIRVKSGISRVPRGDHYSQSKPGLRRFPAVCRNCESPRCVDACMSGALSRREDATVVLDEERCVGCGMCVMVCPNDAIHIDRKKGKALKCDLCGNGEIACVAACIAGALFVGSGGEG